MTADLLRSPGDEPAQTILRAESVQGIVSTRFDPSGSRGFELWGLAGDTARHLTRRAAETLEWERMRQRARVLLTFLLCIPFCAPAARAQSTGTAQQSKYGSLHIDLLGREEWTRDIPQDDGTTRNESRWSIQGRPRYEIAMGPFDLGVGAAINYSQDKNYEAPAGGTLTIIRDNYRSRDIRLDLAYGRVKLGPVIAQGGRFAMPLPLTEMVWDRDLRPQGGAASLDLGGGNSSTRLALTGIYAIGSHVFEDKSVMYGGSAALTLAAGATSGLQLAGSYLLFDKLDKLDPLLARQNSVLGGRYSYDYHVADAVVRFSSGGSLTLVADYCWNTALDANNRGLWLSATLGAASTTVAQFDYTYARIDRDATVAAFNTDDFYWGTAWEGHRIELSRATARNSSAHAIAQWQRPLGDGATNREWVLRWRLEWRSTF